MTTAEAIRILGLECRQSDKALLLYYSDPFGGYQIEITAIDVKIIGFETSVFLNEQKLDALKFLILSMRRKRNDN